MHHDTSFANRILFGAAFYDEYRVTGSLDRDLELMAEASFSVIRVGESVWSTWEPRPGEFHLDWLQPVLDGAARHGIDVILGTPTYAVPQWLQRLHPEIAAEDRTGRRVPWGQRQEINFAHPMFRTYAARLVRKQIRRYAGHPAVIGFQVDNEPGLHLLHNADVFAGFLDYLRLRYRTVDELNRAWGLTFWSHRLTDWDQLWTPDGNHSPQYQIEWRRYQARVVDDFIGWQADIVREYASAEQFVTTCISYERPAVDDVSLVKRLDVTAGNPYYKMQDALRLGVEVPRQEIWWSSGVWALFQQGDRMFSSAQEPFLVTETNAQSIGQSHWQNHPPYPGQIALAALTLISRGARMIEYWQWQTLQHGIETYWGGVLPHSGRPGRIHREISALGARLRTVGRYLDGYRPDADVVLLYSTDTKRSYEFYPPLALADGGPDRQAYLSIFDAYYRGAFESGAQTCILHAEQFIEQDASTFAARHPVLIVPTLYIADDRTLHALAAYAAAGGHLVIGIRTGYGDELARARAEVAPGILAAPSGIHYDEYTTLDEGIGVEGDLPGLRPDARALGWADGLEVDSAEVLVSYADGLYRGRAAVTTNAWGDGRVTYVGTVPNQDLANALIRWASPSRLADPWHLPATVTLSSGCSSSGRIWFLANWSVEPVDVTLPHDLRDGDDDLPSGAVLRLPPMGEKVLVGALAPTDATTETSISNAEHV